MVTRAAQAGAAFGATERVARYVDLP